MANINLGCDFSTEHIRAIADLVELQVKDNTPNRVTHVYGSPRAGNPFGSTRPLARETEGDMTHLRTALGWLQSLGITPCIAFNSLFPHLRHLGPIANVFDNHQARQTLDMFCEEFQKYKVLWIVAHPYIVDWMHASLDEPSIILSTIMNIHSIPQVAWIKRNWPGVVRICPALWKNRNFSWLCKANSIIPLELLANEFCSIGGVECEGLYRQACYMSQTMDVKHWNPMLTRCIESRQQKPWSWLMAKFILPQWMSIYGCIGIDFFKITGRTHPAAYIKAVGEEYIRGKATGNLLHLWGQLEATLNKENWSAEQKSATDIINIPIEYIEDTMLSIAHNKPAGKFTNCNPDICGIACNYCARMYHHITERIDNAKDCARKSESTE